MQSRRDMLQLGIRFAMWGVPGFILLWHALQYAFVTDDAYISFVYARNLAEHGQLAFNLGDPVEGYSNLLWTVTLAAFMRLGLAPEVMSQVLGIGFACGTLVVASRIVRVSSGGDFSLWEGVAPLLLSMSAGFACWSSGGLETQMFTFWVTAALYAYVRADSEPRWMVRVGVLMALACLTRPEGALVTAVIGAHRFVLAAARDRRVLPRREDWIAAGIVVATLAVLTAWRLWYYGHPLPNTYYVKAAGDAPEGYQSALWSGGWYYVWQWAKQSGALWASPLFAVGALMANPRGPRFVVGSVAAATIAVYLLYTASVGGDFMGLHRFVMPLFPLVAIGVALGFRALAARVPVLAAATAAAVIVGLFGVGQVRLTHRSTEWGNWRADHGIDTPAYLMAYTEDRARIGEHMRSCFKDDDFSIVGGAGAQPYYGHMRGIDVFGLVSERVAHEVRPTRPRAGHNKWAPDSLLASLEPDFVFSCYSIHRDPKKPRLNCRPTFWQKRGFELLTVRIPGLRQQGEYYTFLARKDRQFRCPGLVGAEP